MMPGKSLPLPDLRVPSGSLRASCWLRNDRMLTEGGAFPKAQSAMAQPGLRHHAAQRALEASGQAQFPDGSFTRLCQALGIHWWSKQTHSAPPRRSFECSGHIHTLSEARRG